MSFKDRDTILKAQQTKALKKLADEANRHVVTQKQIVKEARAEQDLTRRQDVAKYFISTPLALAEDAVKGSAVKLAIQIPGGPTAHLDDEGKTIYREMGELILLEGEGVTTDPLWAEWVEREFGQDGWEVSELLPVGLASYARDIQDTKAQLQLQGV